MHNKPTISPTLLFQNMYQNPIVNAVPGPDGMPARLDPRKLQEHFEVCTTFACDVLQPHLYTGFL